jgi:hypothetical protein
MIIEAMAPRVESADGEVSRCASATLDDVGQGTQSKPHREMLARAFFEAWRRHGYRDDAYYDGLSRLGSDAAALAPELEKLVYDPAHGRKAAWLLRAVRRGKTQPIGPRLEEAMPKGDSRDLGTDLE